MKKFFGFGSSTPPPPAPPIKPPAAPSKPSPAAPAKSPIVGRWKEPNGKDTTEFHADGRVTEKPAAGEQIRGHYTVDGSQVKIRLDGVKEELVFTATFRGETLEMRDPAGATTRYEKA